MSGDFSSNRKSYRIQNWNYGWKGLYFITVNTRYGENYFGEIEDGKVILNELGKEVVYQWELTVSLRKSMNLELDEFVVMPNHFHGIIGIGRNEFNSYHDQLFNFRNSNESQDINNYGYQNKAGQFPPINKFGPQRKNLASIMRGFKSSVTTWARINNVLFDWHTRFHDIIISDEIALNKIRKYIRNNPAKWNRDRFKKRLKY